jgi:hypothetical protein
MNYHTRVRETNGEHYGDLDEFKNPFLNYLACIEYKIKDMAKAIRLRPK